MHNMNTLQLLQKYQDDTKEHGHVEAMKLLRATGISNALAMEISLCFDTKGNALDFDMEQRRYEFA